MRVNNLLERKNRREAERNGKEKPSAPKATKGSHKGSEKSMRQSRQSNRGGKKKTDKGKKEKSSFGKKIVPSAKATSLLNKNRLLEHSSDDELDGGDQIQQENQAKQELEELDRLYFINDENQMDVTDGFFGKGPKQYGSKKN